MRQEIFWIPKPCLDVRQNPSRDTLFPSYGRRPLSKTKNKTICASTGTGLENFSSNAIYIGHAHGFYNIVVMPYGSCLSNHLNFEPFRELAGKSLKSKQNNVPRSRLKPAISG